MQASSRNFNAKTDSTSGFNYQDSMSPFAKGSELLNNIQNTLWNAMRDLTTLNAEFSHDMIREMQDKMKDFNPLNPTQNALNPDEMKNWTNHIAKHTEKVADISQSVCNVVSSKVKDHCADIVKTATK